MTLKECIEQVTMDKPHAFSNETLTKWINEVEGYVQSEVMLLDTTKNLTTYTWEDNQDTELMVLPPHDKLYISYLEAKIDYKNSEDDRYQNSMSMYNDQMLEFTLWFIDMYHPADIPCGGEL